MRLPGGRFVFSVATMVLPMILAGLCRQASGDASGASERVTAADLLRNLDSARSLGEYQRINQAMERLPKSARGELMRYVDNKGKNGRKRFMALRAVFQLSSSETAAGEACRVFSRDADREFRMNCAIFMGEYGGEQIRRTLRGVLHSSGGDPGVQLAAAAGLAKMGDDSGKERALKAVLDSEPALDIGIVALEALKARDVVTPLRLRMTGSSEYRSKNACRLAILRIELASAGTDRGTGLLQDALMEDGYPEAREWAGMKLGETGGKAAMQVLTRVAGDPKAPGRREAANGLILGAERGHWRRSEAGKWLEQ